MGRGPGRRDALREIPWTWRESRPTRGVSLAIDHLLVADTGNVIVTTYHFMSDRGAECLALDTRSGEVLWTRSIAGLRVDHSEYFHKA